MVKKEIVSIVAEEIGYSQIAISEIVDSLLENIMNEVSKGNKVQFMGFGVFEPKEKAARIGRNPHTNQPVEIPKRIVPSFKPGNHFKSVVIQTDC